MRAIRIYYEDFIDKYLYIIADDSGNCKYYNSDEFVEVLARPHNSQVDMLTLDDGDVVNKCWINGADIVEDDEANECARRLVDGDYNGEAPIEDFNAVWSNLAEAAELGQETYVDNRRFLMCVDDEDVAMIVDDLGRVLTYPKMLQLWQQPHSGMYYLHIIDFCMRDYKFTTIPAIGGTLADALCQLLTVAKPLSRTEFDAIWEAAPDVFAIKDDEQDDDKCGGDCENCEHCHKEEEAE